MTDDYGQDGNEQKTEERAESKIEVNAPEATVVDFKQSPGAKKKGASKKDKESNFLYAIRHGSHPLWEGNFPAKYALLEDPRRIRSVVMIKAQEVCVPVADDALIDDLIKYSHTELVKGKADALTLSSREAAEIFRIWRATTEPISTEDISPVKELSDKGLCWQRLPFDLTEGETTAFDELFSRVSNGEALKAWIGSLLDAESDKQQYVWLWGPGSTGKSSLANVLRRMMGPSFRSEQPPEKWDKFWTSSLLGARLVVFPDCNDTKFVTSGLFKSLTGGDMVKIEYKGKQPQTVALHAKYMVLSNHRPEIGSGVEDQRRTIYCGVEELSVGTRILSANVYLERLWLEASAFLFSCRQLYKRKCPDHGQIPTDTRSVEELTAWNEADLEEAFDKFFEPRAEGERNILDRPHLPIAIFQAFFERMKWDSNREKNRFYEWMERKHRIFRRRTKVEGKNMPRILVGIVLTKWAEQEFAAILKREL